MSEQVKPQQIVLKNARVRYAKVIKPGHAFDEGQPDLWSVNIYPTDSDRELLLASGATEKIDKNGEGFFIAKRNTVNKKNEAVQPPPVVDAKKVPFTQEVGNGSVCNIAITPFAWTKGKSSGVLLYLNAVQVVNHVAASQGVDAFDVVDTGSAEEKDDLPF